MIDLILLATVIGSGCGGFYLGSKYKTVRAMIDDLKSKV